MKLYETSKLNPGKNAIKASLLGSKSANALVKTAASALKKWPKLDRAAKKEVYAKLAELKKVARENMRNEISKVKPEQRKAATEKATEMYASFVAAVKKREKKAENSEDQTTDISALEKQRDELKDWLTSAEEELYKAVEGKSDDEAEAIADKFMADAIKKADQYKEILAKIEDAKKSNEAFAYLNEWFDLLLEFDADAAAEKIKDAAEKVSSGGGDSDSGNSEDKEDSLKERISELDNEIEELEAELDELRDEKRNVNSYLQELKDEGEDEDEIKEYEREADKLMSKGNEIAVDIIKLKQEKSELEEELADLMKESVKPFSILNFAQFLNERINR